SDGVEARVIPVAGGRVDAARAAVLPGGRVEPGGDGERAGADRRAAQARRGVDARLLGLRRRGRGVHLRAAGLQALVQRLRERRASGGGAGRVAERAAHADVCVGGAVIADVGAADRARAQVAIALVHRDHRLLAAGEEVRGRAGAQVLVGDIAAIAGGNV